MVCPRKVFIIDNILYIVWKILKRRIQRWYFRKHQLKPYRWKIPKILKLYTQNRYVSEKFLVIVKCYKSLERFWKGQFNDNVLENIDWIYIYSYKYK